MVVISYMNNNCKLMHGNCNNNKQNEHWPWPSLECLMIGTNNGSLNWQGCHKASDVDLHTTGWGGGHSNSKDCLMPITNEKL